MYGGMATAETCSAAVVRLGMQTTKQLVLTFALKVGQTKNPMVRNRMQVLWITSSQIAALCFVLAREIKGMQAEEALLIGLLHDDGAIAILNQPSKISGPGVDEDGLERPYRACAGTGAMILRNWMLPAPVVAGARDAEYWLRQHQAPADFTDLLVVAQVHECLRKKDQLNGLPPLEKISAFKRVSGEDATPERSLQIQNDAKSQADEMRSVLRAWTMLRARAAEPRRQTCARVPGERG